MKSHLNKDSDSEEQLIEMSSHSANDKEELEKFVQQNEKSVLNSLEKIPAFGMLLGILSVFFQLAMFTNVKILYNESSITSFEIVFIRGISDLTITSIVCRCLHIDVLDIKPEHRSAIRFRMFFAASSAFFVFLTFQLNPISIATTLTFTSPIFTSIFTFFLIGEKLSKYDVANIIS